MSNSSTLITPDLVKDIDGKTNALSLKVIDEVDKRLTILVNNIFRQLMIIVAMIVVGFIIIVLIISITAGTVESSKQK